MLFRSHRGLFCLLAGHALVFWGVLSSGSPWTTASLECATGGIADVLLSESSWSPWDTFQGALGGMFFTAVVGLPLFAIFGVGAGTTQLLAYLGAAALLCIVYVLLDRHESRRAALLAAAGLAFAPPVLFHPSTVLGNWHWTQLIFDYGLALFALELLRRRRATWIWGLFGLAGGLAIFHCMGSLPFVGLSVLVALLLGRPGLRRGTAAAAGGLLGLAPFLYKLLLHRPFGHSGGRSEQTLGRLIPREIHLDRLPDLIYPELPWALHFHDTMEAWPGPPGWTLAVIWVAVAWGGFLALLWSLRAPVGAEQPGRRPRLVALLPVAFAGVFVAAYVLLQGELEILPEEFTNIREKGHRNLPMLLAALVVGSAMGWSRLVGLVAPGLGRALLGLALLPAFAGLLSQIALVETGGPAEQRSFHSYRTACVDVLGVFAAASLKGQSWDAVEACSGLEGEQRQGQCRVGAAWGTGVGSARLDARSGPPTTEGPGSLPFTIAAESLAACERLDPELQSECRFGLGWWVGSLNWGAASWPMAACDSLADPGQSSECWTGVGFVLGDHLHPRPQKMGLVLARAPTERQALVAEGLGVALGRSYADETWAGSFCDRMGGPHVAGCRAGVRRAFSQR